MKKIKPLSVSTKRLIRLLKLWSERKFEKGKSPPSYLFEVIAFELTEMKVITDDLRIDLITALTRSHIALFHILFIHRITDGESKVLDPANPLQNVAKGEFWPELVQHAKDLLSGKDQIVKLLQ